MFVNTIAVKLVLALSLLGVFPYTPADFQAGFVYGYTTAVAAQSQTCGSNVSFIG